MIESKLISLHPSNDKKGGANILKKSLLPKQSLYKILQQTHAKEKEKK